jgi:taurine--2-oxoglutarate transaminase
MRAEATGGDEASLVRDERATAVQCYASRQNPPLVFVDGSGCELLDVNGRRYLDFTAQMASACLGHRHPGLIGALRDRLDGVLVGPAYIHPERVRLASRLIEVSGRRFARVYFGVTGSDAVEASLKFARKRAGRWKVISHWNGYHGSTLGALSAHGVAAARQPYEPLLAGFVHVPPPDLRHGDGIPDTNTEQAVARVRNVLEREGPDQIAAFITEPILVGGGMIIPTDSYLAGLRSLCDEFGILLVYDEVVTGMGRTGRMFGFEHAGVVPDMLVLGKGLTAGSQALSAVLVRREADPFAGWTSADPTHLHTLAGNALGCAAGLATIAAIESEGLVENARLRGLELISGLRAALRDQVRVLDVRGRGLLVGVELDPRDEDPKSLERRATLAVRELGVLVQGNSGPHALLVLHPPLTISAPEIARAVGAISDSLGRLG